MSNNDENLSGKEDTYFKRKQEELVQNDTFTEEDIKYIQDKMEYLSRKFKGAKNVRKIILNVMVEDPIYKKKREFRESVSAEDEID